MRAQLMEFTPVSPTASRKAVWANMSFTMVWQSSKVPSIAITWTFSSATVVICRRCTGDTRSWG